MATSNPTAYQSWKRAFTAECARLAQLAHSRYCDNLTRLYLVGSQRPTTDGPLWERLSVATADEVSQRPELAYVAPEPLRRDVTLAHQTDIVREILKREPLALVADHYAGR